MHGDADMAGRRIPMRNREETLRLRQHSGWSVRRISDVVDVSVGSVQNVLTHARRAGIEWPLPADMDEANLAGV